MKLFSKNLGSVLAGILVCLSHCADAQPLDSCRTFAIVPQQSASDLAEAWTPLLARISRLSGVSLCFATAPDIAMFYQRLARGEYDFAYMNPYQYTLFHKQPGYIAMAKEKGRRLKGIIVVNKDAPFRELADLAGKKLAFPSPTSFAASILTQAELRRVGIRFERSYVASHESVYLGVARGVFAAGGGIPRTLELLEPAARGQLRVLWASPSHPPHAIAHHPRVAPETVDAVRKAMLELDQSPEGRKELGALAFKGLDVATDSDWNSIRALPIDPEDFSAK